jgi:hypothetical protein
VTAPLTPDEQPPPLPPYPGGAGNPGGEDGEGGEGEGDSPWREAGRGALVAVFVTVCGVALALLWWWLSPRVPMVSDGRAVYLKDTEGEEAVGGDGVFVLLALALGALTALLVFLRYRRAGVAIVLGLAAGGVLASVVGWRLGVWLGPTTDIVAHARAVGPKKVFDGPLVLGAKGALVAWPVAAMLAQICLTSLFGPRDPEPKYPGSPWGTPGQPWGTPAPAAPAPTSPPAPPAPGA